MILYQLRCGNDHEFESWFKDSATFDAQAKRKAIDCPECGDTDIRKAPMAPRVGASKGGDLSDVPEKAREFQRAMNMMRRHVEENCDYVGDKFADEARAIHYGETEERGIYGEASLREVKDLVEEEIPVAPVPMKPKGRNKPS